MSNTNNSDIDDIVEELRASSVPTHSAKNDPIQIPIVTDENVGNYIYQKSVEMIELALASIRSMQFLIASAADPKEITAYANLISVASKAVDNLNKINLQQKQAVNNIEVKKIEAESRGKGGNSLLGQPNGGVQNNNIFIGSSDDAMKMLRNGQSNTPKKIELLDDDIIENS